MLPPRHAPMVHTEIVAIIPARGNSKGLPRKNILHVGGKPLIAYSIEAALAAQSVDRIIVDTDDEAIARIARDYGAETPYIRESGLAMDDSPLSDVFRNAVRQLQHIGIDIFAYVELYPTHPFRPAGLIDLLVDQVRKGARSAGTVRAINHPQELYFSMDESSTLRPVLASGTPPMRGFRSYGLCWVHGTNPISTDIYTHEIDAPLSLIDIDTPEDLALADVVANQYLRREEQCEC